MSDKKELIEICNEKSLPELRYNKALLLALKTGLHNLRYYNAGAFSIERLDSLIFDLKMHLSVGDLDIAQAAPGGVEDVAMPGVDIESEALQAALHAALESAKDLAKDGFKIATMYPFIDDAATPDVLKVLVSDMMTAYRAFVSGHGELSILIYGDEAQGIPATTLTAEQLFELGGAVIAHWQLNELIHEELTYYGEFKKVLGAHPKLKELLLAQKLEALDLAKYPERIKQCERNILSNTKKLTTAKSDASRATIQQRINEYVTEKEAMEAVLKEAASKQLAAGEVLDAQDVIAEPEVDASE